MVLSANLMGIDAEVQNKGPVRAMIFRRTGFRAKIADDTTCATELVCARGNASISSPKPRLCFDRSLAKTLVRLRQSAFYLAANSPTVTRA